MDAALAGAYGVVALVTASLGARVVRAGLSKTPTERYWRAAIDLTLLGTAFFVPFFVLGTLELLVGGPRVTFGALVVVAVAQLLFCFAAYRRAGTVPTVPESPAGRIRWTSGAGLAAIATVVVFAIVGVMLSVGFPRGYEVSAYHLPIALNAFQTGSLRVWDEAYMHTFPANASLYAGLLLHALPERLVSIANLPFVLLGSFAVYGLARAAGGTSDDSLLAGTGFASVPIVAFSGFEIGADVAGVAFLGLAYVVALAAPDRRPIWFVLAGCAAGLAFGFKSLHLVGAAFLGPVVLWRGRRGAHPDASSPGSGAVAAGAGYGIAFLAIAGFWLLRNHVELGNPLYPVHLGAVFDALGWTKAPDVDYTSRVETQLEWVEAPWQWWIYPWVEGHYLGQNFKHSSGLGAFVATVLPVAWIAGIATTVRRWLSPREVTRRDGAAANVAVLALGCAFIAAAWWILVDRQPRYLMGALVLGLALFAPLQRRLSRRGARLFRGLAVAAVLFMLAIIGSRQLIEFGSRYVVGGQFSRAAFYDYPAAIDDLPDGTVLINLGTRTDNYALYGDDLGHRVVSPNAVALAAGEDRLPVSLVCASGATHLYTAAESRFGLPPSIRLERVDGAVSDPSGARRSGEPGNLWRIVNRKDVCRRAARNESP